MTEKKSDYWLIPVRADMRHKVVFSKKLTEDEALDWYNCGYYEDILDTYTNNEEVLDWAEPLGSDEEESEDAP